MFEHKDMEKILEEIKTQIDELSIRNEGLDRITSELLEELNVTPEQLSAFIENKENFTDDDWKKLQSEKCKLEERLQNEIGSTRNPLEVKKAYSERNISNHWLFVK